MFTKKASNIIMIPNAHNLTVEWAKTHIECGRTIRNSSYEFRDNSEFFVHKHLHIHCVGFFAYTPSLDQNINIKHPYTIYMSNMWIRLKTRRWLGHWLWSYQQPGMVGKIRTCIRSIIDVSNFWTINCHTLNNLLVVNNGTIHEIVRRLFLTGELQGYWVVWLILAQRTSHWVPLTRLTTCFTWTTTWKIQKSKNMKWNNR